MAPTTLDWPTRLAPLFRCSRCGGPVRADSAGLTCDAGHTMPFADGFLDAAADPADASTARTLASFGYEWTAFDAIRPEDAEFWRRYVADVDLDRLRGRVAVDVGCGKGRYTRFTAEHVAAMVALDGSDAVRSAARNLRDLPNTVTVRATVEAMPLAPGGFDLVCCLGVLHHLSDPRAGFDRLVRLLAPGGILLLYVYSRPQRRGVRAAALAAARLLRRGTVRLPHRPLRALSAPLAAALYAGFVAPGRLGDRLGIRRLAALPLAFYRGKPVRSLWLDTFDRLSAPVENRYVWADLAPWFAAAGLTVERVREESGLFIVARR